MIKGLGLQGSPDLAHVFLDRPEPIDRRMIRQHLPIFLLGEIVDFDARHLLASGAKLKLKDAHNADAIGHAAYMKHAGIVSMIKSALRGQGANHAALRGQEATAT